MLSYGYRVAILGSLHLECFRHFTIYFFNPKRIQSFRKKIQRLRRVLLWQPDWIFTAKRKIIVQIIPR